MPRRFRSYSSGYAANEGLGFRAGADPVGIVGIPGDRPEPSTGNFYDYAYGMQGANEVQGMLEDTMRTRQQFSLAGMRMQAEADRDLQERLEKGDLILDPEVQGKISDIRKQYLETYSSRTLSRTQKKALEYEMEEETAELRRNFARKPSPEERQNTLQAWRQKITADWSPETWAQYGHLVPLLHPDEKGQPMMPRGVPPSMLERKDALVTPDKYSAEYEKAWTQLYKEYQLTSPVDPKTNQPTVPNPSRLEVEERMRAMGYKLSEPSEADIVGLEAMIETMNRDPEQKKGNEKWYESAVRTVVRYRQARRPHDPAYDGPPPTLEEVERLDQQAEGILRGMPEGSVLLRDGTVRLPNGTIIRRKAQ